MNQQKNLDLSMGLNDQFRQLILSNSQLVELLQQLRAIEPMAYLSAGVLRNWIWSYFHDQVYELSSTEVDVIYFDENEVAEVKSESLRHLLNNFYPNMIWDVTNQALVHHWYRRECGGAILPYCSIFDALSSWPETATAVAIRLTEDDEIDIIAPFGLNDLFQLKLRWNPKLVSRGVFQQRIASKQFLKRWPKLKVVN